MKRKNTLESVTKELKEHHKIDFLDEKLSLSSYKWFTQYVRKHLYSINTKNKKNTPDRLEIKKFNPILKRVTVHKEIK